MIIEKGRQLQFKAKGHWKDVVANQNFNTNDERWNLSIKNEYGDYENFSPRKDSCKLRIIKNGKPRLLFDKRDIDIWQEINDRISNSNIKRYPWHLILGDSLTKTILRKKMSGKTAQQTYDSILSMENFNKIKQAFPEHAKKMESNIFISVCARFGENNTALNLFRKEFSK